MKDGLSVVSVIGKPNIGKSTLINRICSVSYTHLSGNTIGIFPEGTRSSGEEIGKGHKGLALIAYLTGAPILPMAVCNLKKVSHGRKKTIRPKIRIIFGDIINTEEFFRKYPKREGIDMLSAYVIDDLKKLFSRINY